MEHLGSCNQRKKSGIIRRQYIKFSGVLLCVSTKKLMFIKNHISCNVYMPNTTIAPTAPLSGVLLCVNTKKLMFIKNHISCNVYMPNTTIEPTALVNFTVPLENAGIVICVCFQV